MPQDIRPGGLKAVHYSDTGAVGSWTKIISDLTKNTEKLTPDAIKTDLTNSSVQSGRSWNPTLHFDDFQDKATLEGFAIGASRAKKFFALEFYDGTILKSAQAIYPIVNDNLMANRSDGDNEWTLEIALDDDLCFTKIASLT